jgi:hypothetical protein
MKLNRNDKMWPEVRDKELPRKLAGNEISQCKCPDDFIFN